MREDLAINIRLYQLKRCAPGQVSFNSIEVGLINIRLIKNLVSLLLFLIYQFDASSQSAYKHVFGRVLDRQGESLAFAHVYIDKESGTIANDSGYFRLNIPSKANGYLKTSLIGYVKDSVDISSLSGNSEVIIRLEESKSLLKSVTVTAEREQDSSYVILNLVRKNLYKNYPKKKYSMEAFYRESSINDTTYSRLVEGYFTISDKGYDSPIEKTKIKKLHFRKTEDRRNLDWRSALSEWLYRKNGISSLLEADRLKLKEEPNYHFDIDRKENNETLKNANGISFRFLSQRFIDSTSFYIDDIVEENGEAFYIIKYEKSPKYRMMYVSKAQGEIRVNKSDWAIVSWSSTHLFDEERYIEERLLNLPDRKRKNYKKIEDTRYLRQVNNAINDSIFYSIDYLYNKHSDGKYYLKYVNHKTIGSTSHSWQTASFEQSYDSNFSQGNIYTSLELEIAKIKKYEKISWWDNLDSNDDIYELSTTQSNDFWQNANHTSLVNLSGKMIRDLSKGNEQKIDYVDK
jgi:hypothetical protein